MHHSRICAAIGVIVLAAGCASTDRQPEASGSGGNMNAVAGSGGTVAGTSAGGQTEAGGTSGNTGAGGAGGSTGGGGAGGTSGIAGVAGVGGSMASCTPPMDVFSPIETLSATGCVDPSDPRKPISSAVSYEVNSPLWSDSADKERAFVLPPGGAIHVRDCVANPSDCPGGIADDGRWDFPVGTVMIKIFMFDSKLVETRLFMHVDSDDWVGYSYEWDEAQTDAKIVSSDRVAVMFNTGTRSVAWHYPSQDDCLNCHNRAAGSTLGPETAQMNRVVGSVNQIDEFASLGLFENAPAKPYKQALVTPYAGQLGSPPPDATAEQKARSYLHANCAFCHRPDGNFANFDLRYDTTLKNMDICNVGVEKGAIPSAPGKTKIMVPGDDMASVMWLRMNASDEDNGRMPQIASYVVDTDAVTVVGDWINSVSNCP
jgi:uncharacterized repeat protein (TIGR03806 family)